MKYISEVDPIILKLANKYSYPCNMCIMNGGKFNITTSRRLRTRCKTITDYGFCPIPNAKTYEDIKDMLE